MGFRCVLDLAALLGIEAKSGNILLFISDAATTLSAQLKSFDGWFDRS